MRIVAIADTHTFEGDLGALPEGDVFVHAGDMLRGGSLEELAGVAPWLRALPHRHKVIIAGNHDWCFARARDSALALLGDGFTYLEDSAASIDGVSFWGSPWQPRFNDWAFNLERGAEIAAKWSLIPESTDVLITHGPPAGFGDYFGMPERLGCEDLLAAIERAVPRLHLFGHIHQDGGFWRHGDAALANVTTWECERAPTVIDLDPATGAVVPVAIPPAQIDRS